MNNIRYTREMLLDVISSYITMIERDDGEHPSAVLSDIYASCNAVLAANSLSNFSRVEITKKKCSDEESYYMSSILEQMSGVCDYSLKKLVEELIDRGVKAADIIKTVNPMLEVLGHNWRLYLPSPEEDAVYQDLITENIMELTREYTGYVQSGRIEEDGLSSVSLWDQYKSKAKDFAVELQRQLTDEEEDYLTFVDGFAIETFTKEGWLRKPEDALPDIRTAVLLVTRCETDDGPVLHSFISPDMNDAESKLAMYLESEGIKEDDPDFNYDYIHTEFNANGYKRK